MFNPAEPRDHQGKWTDGGGAPWLWADDEERFSLATDVPDGFVDKISADERHAVERYTTGGYRGLNEVLRDGRTLTAEQGALAAHLRSVIAKAGERDKPQTVWRGVHVFAPPLGAEGAGTVGREREALTMRKMADWAEANFKPGEEIHLGGFQSTSTYTEPALNAATGTNSPGVIFEIQTRSGAPLDPLSHFDDEGEVLLNANTTYRVRKVLRRVVFRQEDGADIERTVIQMVAINGAGGTVKQL